MCPSTIQYTTSLLHPRRPYLRHPTPTLTLTSHSIFFFRLYINTFRDIYFLLSYWTRKINKKCTYFFKNRKHQGAFFFPFLFVSSQILKNHLSSLFKVHILFYFLQIAFCHRIYTNEWPLNNYWKKEMILFFLHIYISILSWNPSSTWYFLSIKTSQLLIS